MTPIINNIVERALDSYGECEMIPYPILRIVTFLATMSVQYVNWYIPWQTSSTIDARCNLQPHGENAILFHFGIKRKSLFNYY